MPHTEQDFYKRIEMPLSTFMRKRSGLKILSVRLGFLPSQISWKILDWDISTSIMTQQGPAFLSE